MNQTIILENRHTPNSASTKNLREIIGLDLSQETVRFVNLEIHGQASETVLVDHRRFQGREELESYWSQYLTSPYLHVAVSMQDRDPHAVLPWLNTKGVAIEFHSHPERSWTRLRLKEESAYWSLPKAYAHAYTVAFLSAYRLHAATIVKQLSTELMTQQDVLREFQDELLRLAEALPEPGQRPRQWDDEIPF